MKTHMDEVAAALFECLTGEPDLQRLKTAMAHFKNKRARYLRSMEGFSKLWAAMEEAISKEQ